MPTIKQTICLSLLLTLPFGVHALERSQLIAPGPNSWLRITDTDGFIERLKDSSIGKLMADRQFQDFVGNPETNAWQDVLFESTSDAERQIITEQLDMINGEVILIFEPDHEAPAIIAAMSDDDFERSLELDENMQELNSTSFEILRSTFQDVLVIQHLENPDTPEESSTWQAHLNNTLVLGHSREWIERSIVALKKEDIEEPKGDPSLHVRIPVADLIRRSLKEDGPSTGEEALFEALGIMAIDGFSASVELKPDEMVMDNRLNITELGRGLFTLLDVQPTELPTVSFIPDNIASLEVGRFNLLGLWQEIPNVLSTAQPQMKPQFDMILGSIQQQAGINLEQDLLANLGTKYIYYSIVESDRMINVMAIDLRDGAAFKHGFETAMASPTLQPYVSSMLDTTDFLDRSIYSVKNLAPGEEVAFALSGAHLLYGHPDGVRQVIRAKNSDVAANQQFEQSRLVQGLRKHVPGRAFAFSAVDWKKNMEAVVQEFSKPEYARAMEQKLASSKWPLPQPDFEKLPPAEHIASFFDVSYQYTEATSEGLHQKIILKY